MSPVGGNFGQVLGPDGQPSRLADVGQESPSRTAYPGELPRIIGHRGAAASAPENTLAGLRRAAALGVRWVEFDVKLSACGEPVLMHDDTVDRTTNGRGRVADMALAELRRLDAGAWLGPNFVGERIPTLGEALATAAELGLGVNVEIKPSPGQAAETARAVAEALAAAWPGDRPTPLVSSFSVEALAAARDAAPDLPRGLLFGRPPADWRALADELRSATLNAGHRHLSRRSVDRLKAAGLPLLAYTVNDAARARDLFGWGVDGVFTDVPEVMSEWL